MTLLTAETSSTHYRCAEKYQHRTADPQPTFKDGLALEFPAGHEG
jgi:hypothetical protein